MVSSFFCGYTIFQSINLLKQMLFQKRRQVLELLQIEWIKVRGTYHRTPLQDKGIWDCGQSEKCGMTSGCQNRETVWDAWNKGDVARALGRGMHVLINACNVTAAGPRVVVLNLLPSLLHVMSNATFTILLPDNEFSRSMVLPGNGERVYVGISRGNFNDIRRIGQLLWWISRFARKLGPDLCLTFG